MPRRALLTLPALIIAAALTATVAINPGPTSAGATLPTPQFAAGIDAYAAYEGQTECASVPTPGLLALRQLIATSYPGVAGLGQLIRDCAQGGKSEHKDGRAVDWIVNVNSPVQRAAAEDFLGWLLATDVHGNAHANLRRLGIMYVIWNRQVFEAYRRDPAWAPYNGASPHTDHIHISMSWAGARLETSWWASTPRSEDSGVIAHWRRLGAGASFLGAVATPEFGVPGGVAQDFAGGRIYWSTRTGGRSMRGDILARYAGLDGTATPLGFPIADEGPARDGGAYSLTTGGKVMWHPLFGAHPVWSGMVKLYTAKGAEWGVLSYPLEAERATTTPGVVRQRFEFGALYWSADRGVLLVGGAIYRRYLAEGAEEGSLGVPVSREYTVPGGARSDFAHGALTWSAATGEVTLTH